MFLRYYSLSYVWYCKMHTRNKHINKRLCKCRSKIIKNDSTNKYILRQKIREKNDKQNVNKAELKDQREHCT